MKNVHLALRCSHSPSTSPTPALLRLFKADYYFLEYQLPDAPFPVHVRITDHDEIRRAYLAFDKVSVKELHKLADLDRFKV